MSQGTTCGQLMSAVGDVRDRAQTALALLHILDPAAVVGKTRPWPPTNPDWRCFFAVPAEPFERIPPINPPTMDWRCQVGIDVTVADLVAFLQAVMDQCLIALKMFEGEDPGRPLPAKPAV